MKDLKKAILEQTDGGFDIYKSIFPNLQRVSENKCKPVLNHFRGEKNPSLSISKYKDRWRHYDFADPELKKNFLILKIQYLFFLDKFSYSCL